MSLSTKELKAIHWYCQQYGLRPGLSAVPTMYFNKGTELVTVDLSTIIDEYKLWIDEDKKIRTRERARIKYERVV